MAQNQFPPNNGPRLKRRRPKNDGWPKGLSQERNGNGETCAGAPVSVSLPSFPPKGYFSLENGKRAAKSTSWPAIRHLSACWPRKHSKNSRQQHWALHHPHRTLLFAISLQDPGNFTRFLMTIMTTIKYKSPWRNNMPRIYLSPAISLQPRTHTISFYGRGPKGKWRPWPWPMVIWKYGNYEAALYKAKNKKKILVGESELENREARTSDTATVSVLIRRP